MKTVKSLLKKMSLQEKLIVYCPTIRDLENVYSAFLNNKISSVTYHSQASKELNFVNFVKWKGSSDMKVMIATTAFGMGIDFASVKHVLHYKLPYSLENYVQECGRAGRNDNLSTCYLFWSDLDYASSKQYLSEFQLQMILLVKEYCASKICRRRILTSYFDKEGLDCLFSNSVLCDNCEIAKTSSLTNGIP